MKIRFSTVTAVVGVVLTLFTGLVMARSASARTGQAVQATLGVIIPVVGDQVQASYVGASKCKKCHLGIYKSWEKTTMAKTFETLKPGNAAEAKTKHGLDPAKDYTTDETCLKCHTTGFGAEGGFAIPDPNDKKAVRRAKKLAGVGCEACHGPASEYLKIHEEIYRSKRTYKVEEMHALGMRKMDASACTSCHNEQSTFFDASQPFDFEKMKHEGMHERTEMQQREN